MPISVTAGILTVQKSEKTPLGEMLLIILSSFSADNAWLGGKKLNMQTDNKRRSTLRNLSSEFRGHTPALPPPPDTLLQTEMYVLTYLQLRIFRKSTHLIGSWGCSLAARLAARPCCSWKLASSSVSASDSQRTPIYCEYDCRMETDCCRQHMQYCISLEIVQMDACWSILITNLKLCHPGLLQLTQWSLPMGALISANCWLF